MKRLLFGAVLISTVGMMAQAPAPTTPRKPGLTLTSTAFEDGGIIPSKYTQSAVAPATPISPKLTWANAPANAASFVLILQDPDTALNHTAAEVLHWMVFNIPGTATELPEGMSDQAQLPDGTIQALNQTKKVGFLGPGAGAQGPYHHYTFELFALDTKLALGADATHADVIKAMDGHILAKGVLEGRFHK